MFSLTTKTSVLKDMVSMASPVSKEIKMAATPDGITIRVVDPSHVEMLSLELRKDAFAAYGSDTADIGVDLTKFADVLKTASDELSMEYDEGHGKLVIKSGNLTRRMAVIDTEAMGDVKIPAVDFTASVTVPTADIAKGTLASAGLSDSITLSANPTSLRLDSGHEGEDTMEMTLSKPTITDMNVPQDVKTTVPLDYFTNAIKAIHMESVTFGISTDYPLRISFASNGMEGFYLIAPRIESE